MNITNRRCRVRRGDGPWLEAVGASLASQLPPGAFPLRAAIVEVAGDEAVMEATVVELTAADRYRDRFADVALYAPRHTVPAAGPFAVVHVVPTGVRCEIGGFAGDACPATNLLAAAADVLITHPNAVNASDLNEMAANVLYVEGKSLDDFLLGHLALVPARGNRIGTFVDPSGRAHLDAVVNALGAARAAAGIDCGTYTLARAEIGIQTAWTPSGCAVGTIAHPDVILDAVEALIAHGAQAVGGVSVIHGVTAAEFTRHLDGRLPNPSGGIEAIVTHLVSAAFRIPAAHAPLPYYHDRKEKSTRNPRAAAEFISDPHYLSVLKGLSRAPRLVPLAELTGVPATAVSVNDVGAVVLPATCLGGVPALCADFNDIPIVAVADNATLLDVTNAKMRMRNVVAVRSYPEAAGVVLALRHGISLESLRRPLAVAAPIEAPAERPVPIGA